jgi:YYY domain-containing protein
VNWIEASARWYGVLALLTWAIAPAVRWLCTALNDRGVTVARPLAVLVAVYPAWLVAALGVAPFGAQAIVGAALVFGVFGWGNMLRLGLDRVWVRALLLTEIASLALFAAYVWLRGYTPQILGTEKPMDIAFLASSARGAVIPPRDPWFAGEPINYYYLGYLLHGSLTRLSGVLPETGFNLALASIFSATTVAGFGLACNIVRPWLGLRLGILSGIVAAFLLALAGNLYAPWRLLQAPAATLSAWWWDSLSGIGWRSSRIVCDGARVANACPPPATETINEFPFFSFLLGDLHPHLMALPYTIVALALTLNLATRIVSAETSSIAWWMRVAISGAVIGALYPLNAWDYPTFLLIAAIAAGIGRPARRTWWRPVAMLAGMSILAWAPFWARYVPPTQATSRAVPTWLDSLPVVAQLASALSVHTGERTSIGEYLTMFGAPFALGICLVLSRGLVVSPAWDVPGWRTVLFATIATIIPGVLLSAPVIPLCGIPLALALVQLTREPRISPQTVALFLFSVAWVLSIGVEIVYIDDAFNNRMNTLFKFYYQTWTLYALAAAASVSVLWAAAGRTWQRAVLGVAVAVMLVAGAAYPVIASYQWTEKFADWRGLDGLAYGEESDADDVAAIRWLAQHAAPGDVVLEAAGCAYLPFGRLPFNRVSAFTGVPTIIGWGNNHQRQWRAGQPDHIAGIARRQEDVAAMYANPGDQLLTTYGVDWLFVGEYESGDWQSECATAGRYDGLNAPDFPGPAWQEAFRSGETVIYQRSG